MNTPFVNNSKSIYSRSSPELEPISPLSLPERKQAVHIYLDNEKDRTHVFKNSSSHERYVILTNEKLQIENRELRDDLSKVNQRSDEFENDLGKTETSMTYLKGSFKNYVILESMAREETKQNRLITSEYVSCHKTFNKRARRYLYILEIIMTLFVAFLYQVEFYTFYQSSLLGLFMIFITATNEYIYNDNILPNTLSYNTVIKKIQKETEELKKGVDFLAEYIDCI
jgi:archaellum component FlaC